MRNHLWVRPLWQYHVTKPLNKSISRMCQAKHLSVFPSLICLWTNSMHLNLLQNSFKSQNRYASFKWHCRWTNLTIELASGSVSQLLRSLKVEEFMAKDGIMADFSTKFLNDVKLENLKELEDQLAINLLAHHNSWIGRIIFFLLSLPCLNFKG